MYVKCQTACVVWWSLTRNLRPLVTAFQGKNCFGTCLGYHYLHPQKCKIEPENDAISKKGSPLQPGSIFRFHAGSLQNFSLMSPQWHNGTDISSRPPGWICPADFFSGSKVLERERESLLEQCLPGKQQLLLFPINFTPKSSKPGFLWKKISHLFYR